MELTFILTEDCNLRRQYDELTPEIIRRPRRFKKSGVIRSFLRGALLSGALTVSVVAAGCDRPKPSPATATATAAVRSTRTDARLKSQVDRIVAEALTPLKGRNNWESRASVRPESLLAANPPVKTASIPVSCGNSYGGLFDTDVAKDATRKLFAAYGITLRKNVRLAGKGYEFVADGYDAGRKLGFKLIAPSNRTRLADQQVVHGPAAATLDAAEIPTLDAAVKAGTLSLFVADAMSFPKMDGDGCTAMRYYLASVVDYLNWVHGDRQVELNRVFGELPGGNRARAWHEDWPALPGCDFESDGDLEYWRVRGGTLSVVRDWSTLGERGLLIELEPGGEVTYAAPGAEGIPIRPDYLGFRCGLYCGDRSAVGAKLVVSLLGEQGKRHGLTATLGERWPEFEPENAREPLPTFARLMAMKIATDSKAPVRIYVDDIRVQTQDYIIRLKAEYARMEAERARQDEQRRRQLAAEYVARVLNRRVPTFQLRDAPLRDVIDTLEENTGLDFRVDWPSLRVAGVSRATPVSFGCGGDSFRDVMGQFIATTGAALEYRVGDRAVYLSSAAEMSHPTPVMLPARGADADANRKAMEQLRQPLERFEAEGVALGDIVDDLEGFIRVPVAADWEALRRVGVGREARVDLNLSLVPREEFLRLILRDAAGDAPVRAIVWDGVVVIGTEESLSDDAFAPAF